MRECQPEKILESITASYGQQFNQRLDERLLKYVVDKEIQKKKEAFLQVQISMAGIGFEGLLELRRHLHQRGRDGGRVEVQKQSGSALLSGKKGSDVLQESVRKRAKKALELSLEQASADEYANLSEEEQQREKRRVYARAYYHRKKKHAGSEVQSARSFKTTPEQRAYQRAYYRRKKLEAVKNAAVEEEGASVVGRPSQDQPPQKELFFSDSEPSQATNLSERDQISARLLGGGEEQVLAADKKGGQVDYEGLASDRMAIEDAFRSGGGVDAESSSQGRDLSRLDAAFVGGAIYPKTKLRKAKSSSLST